MQKIRFVQFDEISAAEILPLLNKPATREHLIDHAVFDLDNVQSWIDDKIQEDANSGCRVRVILVDDQVAGWGGIQLLDGQYEIAIVIDERFWGIGKVVFFEIYGWAKEFGHQSVFIHLLHTRPEYRFLRKMAKNVYASDLLGSQFTTYELQVT